MRVASGGRNDFVVLRYGEVSTLLYSLVPRPFGGGKKRAWYTPTTHASALPRGRYNFSQEIYARAAYILPTTWRRTSLCCRICSEKAEHHYTAEGRIERRQAQH